MPSPNVIPDGSVRLYAEQATLLRHIAHTQPAAGNAEVVARCDQAAYLLEKELGERLSHRAIVEFNQAESAHDPQDCTDPDCDNADCKRVTALSLRLP